MLKILSITLALLSSNVLASSHTWKVNQSIDNFTGEHKISAFISSEQRLPGAMIDVGCYPGQSFKVTVATGRYNGENYTFEDLKYIIDDNKPTDITMTSTSDRLVYTTDINSSLVKDLINGHDTITVQLKSYNYSTSTAKFSLKGSKNAIEEVIKICKK